MSVLLQAAASRSSKCASRGLPNRGRRCFSAADRVHCKLQSQKRQCLPLNSTEALYNGNLESQHVLSRRHSLLLAVTAAGLASDPAFAQPPPAVQTEGTTSVVPLSALGELGPSERQVYKLNKRVQTQNRLLDNFPVFVREGFNVKIIADDYVKSPEGLIYSVLQEGKGSPAKDGQQVVFDYVGYNESGSLIDSSYRQGKPAEATLGIGGVIPGFEVALKSMPPGSRWRVIIPPELGPPVGPSTFFSAKQYEVFDINVLDIKNCSRKPMLMFSQLVCE